MPEKEENPVHNQSERPVMATLRQLQGAIAEGVQGHPETGAVAAGRNLFNRQTVSSSSGDLSFSCGMAATGMRSAACLKGEDLRGNYSNLRSAARQNLPMVILAEIHAHREYHSVSDTGCFQLFASGAQETVDFTLIAHRIAELSLMPGLVAVEQSVARLPWKIRLPSEEDMRTFLGNPDDTIPTPTAAQQMVFGKTRRRVPGWFSLDNPVSLGAKKDNRGLYYESAAKQQFFLRHLPELMEQAFAEYAAVTGRHYAMLAAHKTEDAEHVLLTLGSIFGRAVKAVETMRAQGRKAGCVNLSVLRPFPPVPGKSILALEQITDAQPGETPLFRDLAASGTDTGCLSGYYGAELPPEAIALALQKMFAGRLRNHTWLNMAFTRPSTAYPRHEPLLQAIRREYPDAQDSTLGDPAGEEEDSVKVRTDDMPYAIRHYKDLGAPYTRLSRFYHDTARIYGNAGELVADPFQAVPAMPPAGGGLKVGHPAQLPVFMPESCTGCGDCFVHCPHAALPPVVIGMETLIRAGADMASKKGRPVSQLAPLMKNLAKAANAALRKESRNTAAAAGFLNTAFESLAGRMQMEAQKMQAVRNEFNAVLDETGRLPVAITDAFFNQPDAIEKETGQIFSLAVDPSACTGCGVCTAVCGEEALIMRSASGELHQEAQAVFSLWEQLPDTPGDTVTRMVRDARYDPTAAVLLSRNFYMSMTGGGGDEDAAEKTMLHLVCSLTEYIVQPGIRKMLQTTDEYAESLSAGIHSMLSDALPRQKFEALSGVIAGGGRQTLGEIIGKLSGKEQSKLVDAHALQRKIELHDMLRELRRMLAEGLTGTGRSRFSMALPGALRWAGSYPWNPFMAPVVSTCDAVSPELVKGLAQGQIRHAIDNIKLLRRAKLEAKNKYDPAQHDAGVAALSWKTLTDEEKTWVPPVLMVGKRGMLSREHRASMLALLNTGLPVKAVILDDSIPEAGDPAGDILAQTLSLIPVMGLRSVFVLQGSLAERKHLFAGMVEALKGPRPALLRLFAPDIRRHRIAPGSWFRLAQPALNSRAFPLLKYNPDAGSPFWPAALDLEANPSPAGDWHAEPVDGTGEHPAGYEVTWADWACTLTEWQGHFREVKEGEDTVPLAGYIALDNKSRTGRTPVICSMGQDGQRKQYAVSDVIVSATAAARTAWNTLREVGGTLAGFPEKLREQTGKELRREYEREKEQLKKDFEQKLKTQEQAFREDIRRKLRDKLAAMATPTRET